eukprot:7987626-Alexandrium_andersonii.AAC.1
MSASLVGSEMCIRDSCGKRCSRSRAATGAAVETRPQQGAAVEAELQQEPVSYTHLTLPTICSV